MGVPVLAWTAYARETSYMHAALFAPSTNTALIFLSIGLLLLWISSLGQAKSPNQQPADDTLDRTVKIRIQHCKVIPINRTAKQLHGFSDRTSTANSHGQQSWVVTVRKPAV